MKKKGYWKLILFVFVFFVLFSPYPIIFEKIADGKREGEKLKIEFDSLKIAIEEMRGEREAIIYVPTEAYFCEGRVPIEDDWVRSRLIDELKFYSATSPGRRFINLMLREANGTLPYVEERTLAKGLPADLKYVPVLEAGLSDKAKSWAGAVGRWQIMPETGKGLGLTINRSFDERKHFEKATEAALTKFEKEHPIFGDWFLALAAYNAGVKTIGDALREQPTAGGSYFNLDLKKETAEYCYKLIAIKYVMENPERYGFEQQPYRSIRIELFEYKLKKPKRVIDIAKEFSLPPAQFRKLNEWIEGGTLPKGNYYLRLPAKDSTTSAFWKSRKFDYAALLKK